MSETYNIKYYTISGKYMNQDIDKKVMNNTTEFMNDTKDIDKYPVMIYMKSSIKPITEEEFNKKYGSKN